MDFDERNQAIHLYFEMGLLYIDILRILAENLILSLRHLKRIIMKLGLFRRKQYSNVGDVIEFVQHQLKTSGKLHGYRWMYEKCLSHNIRCKKEDIRIIIGALNPIGVSERRKRRLQRRAYPSKGPNYLWHFDSYDKLKRYGISINGCVDGFSRRAIWVNVYHTAPDSKVVAGYFVEATDKLGACPRSMRGDLGTENVLVRDIQRYLRSGVNEESLQYCYLQGPSTANQHIEYWWSFLRRECTDYWICLFRNLADEYYFNGGFIDVSLVRFCFMHLIQVGINTL